METHLKLTETQTVINLYKYLGILSLFSSRYSWIKVSLFATCQAPLSRGFPRQEYWSVLPFPPAGDLPGPRMEPESPAGRFFTADHQGSHM